MKVLKTISFDMDTLRLLQELQAKLDGKTIHSLIIQSLKVGVAKLLKDEERRARS